MHEYDKSSKWLIQHHGDSILRLAGVERHRRVAALAGRDRPAPPIARRPDRGPPPGAGRADPFVLEVATYPEARVAQQALHDMALVFLDRGVLPEMLVLVLHPKGNQQVAGSAHLQSAFGRTRLQSAWKVVELWTVPAEELLAAGDVGMIPWVPLAHWDGPPEPIFHQCRAASTRMPFPGNERTCWPSRRYWPVCGMMIRDCSRSWEDEKP